MQSKKSEIKQDPSKPFHLEMEKLPNPLSPADLIPSQLKSNPKPQVPLTTTAKTEENVNESAVYVEVVAPKLSPPGGFGDFLKSVTASASKEVEKPTKKKTPKQVEGEEENITDVIVLLVSVVTSAMALADEVKPNDDEINAVSYHASRIVLRHIDPAKKINADMLDAAGILAVCAGWFVRTKDFRNPKKQSVKPLPVQPAKVETVPVGADGIEDGASAGFLANSATKAATRNE